MTKARLKLGGEGEDAAARFLRKLGAKILERNFRSPVGEIDIIARHKNELLFVEVKTRRSEQFGLPAEAVGPRKQRQIVRTAQWYLQQGNGRNLQPRFDVVSVLQTAKGFSVEHFPAAFEA